MQKQSQSEGETVFFEAGRREGGIVLGLSMGLHNVTSQLLTKKLPYCCQRVGMKFSGKGVE